MRRWHLIGWAYSNSSSGGVVNSAASQQEGFQLKLQPGFLCEVFFFCLCLWGFPPSTSSCRAKTYILAQLVILNWPWWPFTWTCKRRKTSPYAPLYFLPDLLLFLDKFNFTILLVKSGKPTNSPTNQPTNQPAVSFLIYLERHWFLHFCPSEPWDLTRLCRGPWSII